MTNTEHFGYNQGELLPRTALSDRIRHKIRDKEEYLGKKCRKLWWFRNILGEDFVFGSFCKNRDKTIVTVAAYVPHVGWISQ